MKAKAIYEPKGKAREYAALALNLRAGCEHGCLYCYMPSILHMSPEDFHARSRPRPGILDALRREAPRYAGTQTPVLLSFSSDPYSPAEQSDKTTREAIAILREHQIPVHVLTKGGMRAARDFDILSEDKRNAFGTTIVFSDDKDRLHWEPGAASCSDRLNAIYQATKYGLRTWISIEPIIVPEQAIWLIENLSGIVDEFRVGKLNYHPAAAEVDWAEWTPRILAALQKSSCDYLVKNSLVAYVPVGAVVEERRGSVMRRK